MIIIMIIIILICTVLVVLDDALLYDGVAVLVLALEDDLELITSVEAGVAVVVRRLDREHGGRTHRRPTQRVALGHAVGRIRCIATQHNAFNKL
jgi:hypothetical protein